VKRRQEDLKVIQTHSTVVAASDYYPFGLVMDGRQVTDVTYRYGYQGQYAEKDNTTGWNEFDLRMYDARFGRWISPDPYGQFASPYLAMGNNPISGTDPDGGFCCGFGYVEGLWNTTRLLDAVVVTAKGASYTLSKAAMSGLKGAVSSAMYSETSPNLTFDEYQLKYTEFLGMTYDEANDHWNKNYSEQFSKEWNEADRIENINETNKKLRHVESYFIGPNGGVPKVNLRATPLRPNVQARGVKSTIPEGKLANHIFSKSPGKLADTPANRKLIFNLANDKTKFIGKDKFGKLWYAKTLDDGSEVYAYVQGGIIKGAGINSSSEVLSRIQF
jgi:RHS repeat-associated protein